MKNLNYYLSCQYTVKIKRNSDGSYFGEIEELPGCMTEADTKGKVLEMIEDAKKAWIVSALENGIKIPEPQTNEFSGKFNVRLPKSLHRRLVYRAKEENVSLNNLVTTALASTIK